MPAATSSAAVVNAIVMAVPRSGSVATSRHAQPTTVSSGRASARRSCTRFGRLASSVAAYSTSASLSSSEGWNCSDPGPIQRRAPLTATPTWGMCTASTSANDTPSRGPTSPCTLATPSRASTRISTRPTAPKATNLIR